MLALLVECSATISAADEGRSAITDQKEHPTDSMATASFLMDTKANRTDSLSGTTKLKTEKTMASGSKTKDGRDEPKKNQVGYSDRVLARRRGLTILFYPVKDSTDKENDTTKVFDQRRAEKYSAAVGQSTAEATASPGWLEKLSTFDELRFSRNVKQRRPF